MKINDLNKLEKILDRLNDAHGMNIGEISCTIGKTDKRVIVISSLNRRVFEEEFNEDFDCIDELNFCLSEKEENQ